MSSEWHKKGLKSSKWIETILVAIVQDSLLEGLGLSTTPEEKKGVFCVGA